MAVDRIEFDADDLASHGAVLDEVVRRHGRIDVVVVAFGILGDQARAEHDAAHAVQVAHTDYVAHVSVLTHLAQLLRAQGDGVVVFSSVAGVRVRRANYVYGSAKAGLDGFASGLADALHGTGVRLLLVRPGFVIGRMTAGMAPAPFATTPTWSPTPPSARCGRVAARCGCPRCCGWCSPACACCRGRCGAGCRDDGPDSPLPPQAEPQPLGRDGPVPARSTSPASAAPAPAGRRGRGRAAAGRPIPRCGRRLGAGAPPNPAGCRAGHA